VVLVAGEPVLERRFGLFVQISPPGSQELIVLAVIAAAALLLGILPAVRAYRNTLSDGLQMRV
jgi:putative ABC transport system permease protein